MNPETDASGHKVYPENKVKPLHAFPQSEPTTRHVDVETQHTLLGTGYILLLLEKVNQTLVHMHGHHGVPQPTARNRLVPPSPVVCEFHRSMNINLTFERCTVFPREVEVALDDRIAEVSDASSRHRNPTAHLLTSLPRVSKNGTPLLYQPRLFIGPLIKPQSNAQRENVILKENLTPNGTASSDAPLVQNPQEPDVVHLVYLH